MPPDASATKDQLLDSAAKAFARDGIAAFVAANPKGRFGTHGYRLADFGLAADALRERFAAYVERYAIPVEVGAEG